MIYFKSKFIYPIFIIRAIFFLALVASLGMFIVIGVPSFWENHPPIEAIGLTIVGVTFFLYLILVFGKSAWMQRFNIIIEGNNAYLKDFLFKSSIQLDSNFKGYSYSSYGDRRALYNFKTLIFYFDYGRIIEFPQFLYLNFKRIHSSLSDMKVTFLCDEPYKWRNLVSRVYRV